MYSLLKDSGYFNTYNDIQELDLLSALSEHPEVINDWLLLSENKRTDSGYYFKQVKSGNYVVGFFSQNEGSKHNEYDNVQKACAAFIKKEIEEIRKS